MTTLTPGQEIGPYRVIEQVGKGGMATVYKAHHAAMDRYVAIKILPFQFAQNKEFNDRFRREVRVIAKLEHPRILPVYDSGEFDGTPYLIMRYLDAGTLKEHIEASRLSLNEIDRIFSQLADALQYAHSHEIVHRDIKPSNVMLTRQGDVFLTDFGIAKLVGEHTQFTASGAITGTPAYMSPEQAEGRPIDARADLYALGIVLYEMVTGRVPYEAETPLAVILKHLQAPLPPPSTITDLHPAIEKVILKALAKNRDDRYASMADLLIAWKDAVQQALSEKTTVAGIPAALETQVAAPAPVKPAAPTGTGTTPPAPALMPARHRRNLWLWIGGGLAGAALLALCVFGALAVFRACCAPPPLPPTPGLGGPPSTPGEELPPVGSLPFPAEGGIWESWTGSGVVYAVDYADGFLIAGGEGGVTVYDTGGNVLEQFTVQDGLPSNRINTLFVDEEGDGNLWVGTDNGLARFDGEELVIYDRDDGLDDSTILFVGRANEDQIAVGTAYSEDGGGLNFFDEDGWWQTGDFDSTSVEDDPNRFSNKVWSVVEDQNTGFLWVATENGVGQYDWEGNWTRYTTDHGLPDNFVTGLFFDLEGTLIAASENGAARFDGESFIPFQQTLGMAINGVVQDEDGRYWFSGGGRIWRYNPENENWESFEGNQQFPAYNAFRSTIDDDGILYFGTDGLGVVRYDGEFTPLARGPGPEQARTWGILESPNGDLFFNEEYGGLIDTYNPANDIWESRTPDCCSIVPFAFRDEGDLWGGGSEGLWILNPNRQPMNIRMEDGLPSNQVYQVGFAPDGVWLATDAGLARLQNLQVVEVVKAADNGMASDWVGNLLAASDGSLWVATETGVSRRTPDGEWEHFSIGNPFTDSFSFAKAFAEDLSGAIWIASWGSGAYRYANGAWDHYTPENAGVALPSPYLNNITIAPDGSVWFSTDFGAARFDGQNWWQWFLEDGLSHWNVNDILVQRDGTVWFATSGGITRWRP